MQLTEVKAYMIYIFFYQFFNSNDISDDLQMQFTLHLKIQNNWTFILKSYHFHFFIFIFFKSTFVLKYKISKVFKLKSLDIFYSFFRSYGVSLRLGQLWVDQTLISCCWSHRLFTQLISGQLIAILAAIFNISISRIISLILTTKINSR